MQEGASGPGDDMLLFLGVVGTEYFTLEFPSETMIFGAIPQIRQITLSISLPKVRTRTILVRRRILGQAANIIAYLEDLGQTLIRSTVA